MKVFALKISLQSGEHEFNMTKLFSSDSLDATEISREFLFSTYGEPEFESDYSAFFDGGDYAVTVESVHALTDQEYDVVKNLL